MTSTINFYVNLQKLKFNLDAYSKIGQVYYPLKTNSNEKIIDVLNELYRGTDNGFLVTHFSHYKQLINQGVSPDKMCLVNVIASDDLIKELYYNGLDILHFNNILINSSYELSIIDFERVNCDYLEREFDPICRMVRNPNSFIGSNFEKIKNLDNFQTIIPYLQERYDVISNDQFLDRILVYDCINSMLWLPHFP